MPYTRAVGDVVTGVPLLVTTAIDALLLPRTT